MIIERSEDRLPPDFPAYLGTDIAGELILGIGMENAFVIKEAVEIVALYEKALRAGGSLSAIEERASLPTSAYAGTRILIQQQIESLKTLPESDDLGRVRPSQHAIEVAKQVTFRMQQTQSGVSAPEDIFTDRDGAIRILWEMGERTLELVCPFETGEKPYIYFSDGREYRIAQDLSIRRLSRLLAWVNSKESAFPK